VSALAELDRSWSEIAAFLQAVLVDSDDEVLAEELLVLPGLEELVSLRALLEVEASGAYDLCVIDCAPTASTLRLLRLPDVLRLVKENFWEMKRRAARALRPVANRVGLGRFVASEEVFDAFERLYEEIDAVRQILLDEDRTSARLVLNPARVVVEETRRAFAYLCLHGVGTDAVLVNRLLPADAAQGWFRRWAEREREELAEIERSFPVPQLHAPLRRGELAGVEALRELGREVYGERDPGACFVQRRPLRIEKRDGRTVVLLDLPTVEREDVDVLVRGDELWIGVRDFERRVSLPASLAGLPVTSAELTKGVLEVELGGEPGTPPRG
jgi:arsenite-transporting ATPase